MRFKECPYRAEQPLGSGVVVFVVPVHECANFQGTPESTQQFSPVAASPQMVGKSHPLIFPQELNKPIGIDTCTERKIYIDICVCHNRSLKL